MTEQIYETVRLRHRDGEWRAFNPYGRCIGRDVDREHCKAKAKYWLKQEGKVINVFQLEQ